MYRRSLLLIAAPTLVVGVLALHSSAQQQPAEGGGGGGATTMPSTNDPRSDGGGGGGPFDDNGGPFHGGPHGPFGGGFGGPGGRGPGGMMMERRMPSMDVQRGYMELVDRYTRLSSDPDAAGVSAVLAANDLYRGKSDEAIAYFTKLIDDVPRPAVKRAIRLQLIDLYKAAGKTELAREQLEILMKAPIDK